MPRASFDIDDQAEFEVSEERSTPPALWLIVAATVLVVALLLLWA